MELIINGQKREFSRSALTVATLLPELGFTNQPVLVELNGRALFPREFPETALHDADRLEMVRLAAGG